MLPHGMIARLVRGGFPGATAAGFFRAAQEQLEGNLEGTKGVPRYGGRK